MSARQFFFKSSAQNFKPWHKVVQDRVRDHKLYGGFLKWGYPIDIPNKMEDFP